jgi:hypothetical protein
LFTSELTRMSIQAAHRPVKPVLLPGSRARRDAERVEPCVDMPSDLYYPPQIDFVQEQKPSTS